MPGATEASQVIPAGGVDGNPQEAARFLSAIFQPSDLILFRPVESWTADGRQFSRAIWKSIVYKRIGVSVPPPPEAPPNSPPIWRTLPQPAIASAIAPLFVISASEYANIYFGVAPRFGPSGAYDFVWQIRKINALWCDVDDVTPAEVADRCRRASPTIPLPTAAVATGGGVHLYWLLDEPFRIEAPDPPAVHREHSAPDAAGKRITRKWFTDPATNEKTYLSNATRPDLHPQAIYLQDILSGLASAIGGDHVSDLSRILRLPGSLNRKDERNGCPPRQTAIVRLDPSCRYPISAFSSFADASPAARDRHHTSHIILPPRRPPARLKSSDNDRLTALINECAAAEVSTRSEVDFHLCCEAVERGWDKQHVWQLAAAVGKFAERGEDYFNRTWDKAENHTREKIFQATRKELQRRANKESGDTAGDTTGDTTTDTARDHSEQDDTQQDQATQPAAALAPTLPTADLHRERLLLDRLQLDVLSIVGSVGVKLFSRFNRRVTSIADISRLTEDHLTLIAGKPATDWLAIDAESADAGKYTLRDIQRAIAIIASYVGYTGDKTKGIGCWRLIDEGRQPQSAIIIVGTNEAAIWNGKYSLHNHPKCGGLLLNFEQHEDFRWIDLSALGNLISAAADPAFIASTLDEAVSLFALWKWKGRMCPPAMVGLVLATFVQTLWEWRPQVNITGASKSGKSVLFSMLSDIFHGLAHLTLDATAAGVRDFIGDSAAIILHDEFDARTDKKHSRQTEIMEMIRASGRGGGSLRSSSSRKAYSSRLSHIFWMSGIDFGSDDEADRNRVVAFELLQPADEIIPPSMHDLRDLGKRLLAIAIRHAIQASNVASTLLRLWSEYARSPQATPEAKRLDSRVIQSYSVPAAMLAVCKGYDPLTTLRDIVLGSVVEEQTIAKDHETMVGDILAAKVMDLPDHPNVSQLVAKMLENWEVVGGHVTYTGDASTEAVLASNGVGLAAYTEDDVQWIKANHSDGSPESAAAVDAICSRGCLLLAYKSISAHLSRGNKAFAAGRSIEQVIGRAPLARRSRRRVGKMNTYVISLPLLWLYDEFIFSSEGAEEENENSFGGRDGESDDGRAVNFRKIRFSECVKQIKRKGIGG
jgi:hypothetical protein